MGRKDFLSPAKNEHNRVLVFRGSQLLACDSLRPACMRAMLIYPDFYPGADPRLNEGLAR